MRFPLALSFLSSLALSAGEVNQETSYRSKDEPGGRAIELNRAELVFQKGGQQLLPIVKRQDKSIFNALQSLNTANQVAELYLESRGATSPSRLPSRMPSSVPTKIPTIRPSQGPTRRPTIWPSALPSHQPSFSPSNVPSMIPSDAPSIVPSDAPSLSPSSAPSAYPSDAPSDVPSDSPSFSPSGVPTAAPSREPSLLPSSVPTVVSVPEVVSAAKGSNNIAAIAGFSVAGLFLMFGGIIVGRRLHAEISQSGGTASRHRHVVDEDDGVDVSIVEGPLPSDITASIGVSTPRYGAESGDEVDRYFLDDGYKSDSGPLSVPEPYSPHSKKHIAIANMIHSQTSSTSQGFRRPSGFISCPEEPYFSDSDSDISRPAQSV